MKSRTRAYPRNRPGPPQGPWKHGQVPVIGIIGEMGGGKSQVAAFMAERGALVLDADAVGHSLLTQRPVREQVVDRFGTSILAPASETDPESPPSIDRGILGALVFAQPALLGDLETILHPRMQVTFEKAIARAQRQGKVSAVVLDAAILFEAGWDSLCDIVLYVDAPRPQRLARLVETRGWTEEKLALRERAQSAPEEKRRQADLVLVNDGGLDRLKEEVNRFWDKKIASVHKRGGSPRSDRPSSPGSGRPSNPRSSSSSDSGPSAGA
ncbi:dephospho-CoA kinase [Singulisphaera acidiphila]|uniref:Dephospho-CoA kinase n=1 Tax=Singulisphaera acidiphila (strain ATCC BAA-1392 / DSM 18658 / VKM B-2454 / MOB10) TaxID=886293 RepID=L0DL06_SINAD|nr:dephospho-CoA kinase [Singulisphaera acidiphila]AGA29510.1 dephospho-CoA kinase [Singulisphaera acidiphila DSM 18658]